jgi:hypothetical protein
MPYEGDLPSSVVGSTAADEGAATLPADQEMTAKDEPVNDDPAVGSEGSDDYWENRTLCSDESCIGVIGPDRRCKACGKPYPG